jgi:hypothetical protein
MKRLTVRIPDGLFSAVDKIAKDENRSFNGQLVHILEMYNDRWYGLEKLRVELSELIEWEKNHG